MWLSVLGVFEWSGNNPLPPEMWLFPYILPFHPERMWCHCRMVYVPMLNLYGKRFVGPITPTVLSLREELFTVTYHEIDWNEARNLCAKIMDGLSQTAQLLKVSLSLSQFPASLVGAPVSVKLSYYAVNVILSLQNPNGGFATYELTISYNWMEMYWESSPTRISPRTAIFFPSGEEEMTLSAMHTTTKPINASECVLKQTLDSASWSSLMASSPILSISTFASSAN